MTNGSGHNQIKIHLTILYEIFSHIQQILLCGIFNFCIPRMLEAFRRVSELQLPFLDAKRGLQTQTPTQTLIGNEKMQCVIVRLGFMFT